MIRKEITIGYQECSSLEELPVELAGLVLEARSAALQAYAPYSGFRVGAAVLLANGVMIKGNNQENAAYPSGLCAERTALFYASANYPETPVSAIAITARNAAGPMNTPVNPCGSCRQVLLETETRFNQPVKIILAGLNSIYIFDGVDSLLPMSFKPSSLKGS